MTKLWIPKSEANQEQQESLAQALGVDSVLAKLLVQRGITTLEQAKKFFRPQLDELLDPFLMKDMDKAVERLSRAIEKQESILVYGDYDVDGTTAVTLVYSFLKDLGVQCQYYIPDRYKEGYGFSFAGVDYAESIGASLIITLDCGIRDAKKIVYAAEKNIDVIVCDHHHVVDMPPAYAVLDAQRKDCDYPFKGLSGCGVGFKMLQGYCQVKNISLDGLFKYLDLLTISIGADIVPVIDENRTLAHYGLKILAEKKKRPGIQAMLDSAGFKKTELTITDVVFILAPRINAAGRMVSGTQAVELLLAKDMETALKLSPALEEINSTRKEFDKSITTEAHQFILDDLFYKTSYSTVVAGKGWHKGVVGIVASRLIDEYYKPTIVLVDDGENMSGSARSIHGIDVLEILDECADLLIQYGGHTMAAGLSLLSKDFDAFRLRFDEKVKQHLQSVMPVPFIEYDAELEFDQITPKFYRVLKQFAPYGPYNMRPVFLAKNIVNAQYTRGVGINEAHLKLHATQIASSGIEMNGIGFDLGAWSQYLNNHGQVDILFSLEENTYNGTTSLQLFVKDIKKSEQETMENNAANSVKSQE